MILIFSCNDWIRVIATVSLSDQRKVIKTQDFHLKMYAAAFEMNKL